MQKIKERQGTHLLYCVIIQRRKEEAGLTENKRYHSISRVIPLLIAASFLLLLIVAMCIIYFREEDRMTKEYRRMADGVTNLMIESLDPDKMDFYIRENYSSPEYMAIMKHFYMLKDNYPDVFYLYVYRFHKGDNGEPLGTIIIDLEDEYTDTPNQVSIDWVGGEYDVLEPFASRIDDLMGSPEPVFETAYSEDDGHLLSFAKPIFDKDGNYVASACVDFLVEDMHRQNLNFILSLSIALILLGIIVMILFIIGLRHEVTKPLTAMARVVSGFKIINEEDRRNNYENLKNLDINSNNEVGMLYDAFLQAEKDNIHYLDNLKIAEDEIHNRDEKINELGYLALRDGMTNVGNKTAFTASVADIKDNDEYGIVLMDVNNLKMINDVYGHAAGDSYLKGCSKLICDVYQHSPVFRIGGDEFAVILKGKDYENRDALMNEFTDNLEKIWTEKEDDPCARYSVSAGMADSTTCRSPRETIKTADDIMYENKRRFKEENGSYR